MSLWDFDCKDCDALPLHQRCASCSIQLLLQKDLFDGLPDELGMNDFSAFCTHFAVKGVAANVHPEDRDYIDLTATVVTIQGILIGAAKPGYFTMVWSNGYKAAFKLVHPFPKTELIETLKSIGLYPDEGDEWKHGVKPF